MDKCRYPVWIMVLLSILLVGLFAWGCGPAVEEDPEDEPEEEPVEEPEEEPEIGMYGGELRVAVNTNPASMDLQTTTETVTTNIMTHVHETFFTVDENLELVPHLVDSYEVNDDATEWVFHLRSGVKFHDGREMTAADAVASFERWGVLCGRGETMFEEEIVSLDVEDTYTFSLSLREPNAVIPLVLSDFQSQYISVMPEDIAREYHEHRIEDVEYIVGTGAFKLTEFLPDEHTRLDRFEDYTARDEASSGLAGERIAYVDTILFKPIPDAMVRLSSVEAGETHFAYVCPRDEFSRMQADPAVETYINPITDHAIAFINMKEGPLADSRLLRQAVRHAVDKEEIMHAAYGLPELFEINHSTLVSDYPLWTDAGSELYEHDKDRARELFEQAKDTGEYDGEPIIWLATTDNMQYYAASITMSAQLAKVGINLDVQVYDWPTVHSLRPQPEMWDGFNTVMGPRPDPVIKPHFNPHWGPFWDNETMLSIISGLRAETNPSKRLELSEELHRLMAEEVPMLVYGHFNPYNVASPGLMDFEYRGGSALFFNTWLDSEYR